MRIPIRTAAASAAITAFAAATLAPSGPAAAEPAPRGKGLVLAQVINGESTDDHAYAPTPPARWHAPSGEPQSSDLDVRAGDEPDARADQEPPHER